MWDSITKVLVLYRHNKSVLKVCLAMPRISNGEKQEKRSHEIQNSMFQTHQIDWNTFYILKTGKLTHSLLTCYTVSKILFKPLSSKLILFYCRSNNMKNAIVVSFSIKYSSEWRWAPQITIQMRQSCCLVTQKIVRTIMMKFKEAL